MERTRNDRLSIPYTSEMRFRYVMGNGSLAMHGLWSEPFCRDKILVLLILQ